MAPLAPRLQLGCTLQQQRRAWPCCKHLHQVRSYTQAIPSRCIMHLSYLQRGLPACPIAKRAHVVLVGLDSPPCTALCWCRQVHLCKCIGRLEYSALCADRLTLVQRLAACREVHTSVLPGAVAPAATQAQTAGGQAVAQTAAANHRSRSNHRTAAVTGGHTWSTATRGRHHTAATAAAAAAVAAVAAATALVVMRMAAVVAAAAATVRAMAAAMAHHSRIVAQKRRAVLRQRLLLPAAVLRSLAMLRLG
jgi:hypothetical protein